MAAVEVVWDSGLVIDYFRGAASRALLDLALEVEDYAKYIAPVRTGTFKESIDSHVDADRLRVVLSSKVFYAGYLEYGTSRMAARPTFRVTLMDFSQRMVSTLAAALREHGVDPRAADMAAAAAASNFGDFHNPFNDM